MKKRIFFNDHGQTAVEYVLLVGVVAVLIFGMLGYLKDNFLPPAGSCTDTDTTLGCSLIRQMESLGTSGNFRYFNLRR